MADHPAGAYGDVIADAYEQLYGDFTVPAEQVALLTRLAQAGPAVEIGSGTGRVAVPLAAAGVPVVGVDASAEMTRVLADRAHRRQLPIVAVHADAATFTERVPGPASLVFAVFNTFFLFGDQRTQAGFFQSAAKAISADGHVIIETFVPRPGRLPDGPHPGEFPVDQVVTIKRSGPNQLVLFAGRNDPEQQEFTYHEVVLDDGAPVRLYPGQMRYCWPAEIDQMAAAAGLRLADRYGDWDQRPYTNRSRKHVSVYQRA